MVSLGQLFLAALAVLLPGWARTLGRQSVCVTFHGEEQTPYSWNKIFPGVCALADQYLILHSCLWRGKPKVIMTGLFFFVSN